jgi:hypothetical protein
MRNSSAVFKYLVKTEHLIGQRIREHEYRLIADYWLREHPSTDTRTRSNVIADYTGLLDVFLRGKIYDIFCKATTVSPDGACLACEADIAADSGARAPFHSGSDPPR